MGSKPAFAVFGQLLIVQLNSAPIKASDPETDAQTMGSNPNPKGPVNCNGGAPM